jgi:outer membrane protein OmpA-like peptidoglycan-associated protein
MKASLLFATVLFFSQFGHSQTLTVEIHLKNELTGKPVDAMLHWPQPDNVRRVSPGYYAVKLQPNEQAALGIEKNGFFDHEVKLDYETEKTDAYHEIKLKPGVPQLNITILDDATNEVIPSAIDLFTMDESSVVFSEEVKVAPYTIDLEYDEVHVLQVRRPGYFSFKDTIDYKGVFDGRSRERKIRLVAIKEGNKIALNNIHFKPNESELTEFAKLMLVELTHVLAREKNIVVEIGAHTDDVGATDYNQSLSEKRAQSVKKHLQEKGAPVTQLLTKGYGELAPITLNDTEEHRTLNRRVEFKIVKVN